MFTIKTTSDAIDEKCNINNRPKQKTINKNSIQLAQKKRSETTKANEQTYPEHIMVESDPDNQKQKQMERENNLKQLLKQRKAI